MNIDVVFHRLPCYILNFDVQDIMGTHSFESEGHLNKNIIDKRGNIVKKYEDITNNQFSYEIIKKSIQDQEGCQLYGNISILKVPGNIHISSNSYANIISKLANDGLYKFDMSHTINHISFGKEDDIKYIKSTFNTGILNPLDNVHKSDTSNKNIYEYYLKVVPTTYIDIDGNKYNVHQFTANSNTLKANMMFPGLFFRYDISPILVKFTQSKERIFQYFVELCAIIGGVYMVCSVILTILINSSSVFFKNKEK